MAAEEYENTAGDQLKNWRTLKNDFINKSDFFCKWTNQNHFFVYKCC